MRAGDARHELHRQRLNACRSIGIDAGALAEWIKTGNDPSAAFYACQRIRLRPLDAQHNIGIAHSASPIGDGRPGIDKSLIGQSCASTSAAFHRDCGAKPDELLYRLWRCSNPSFTNGGFLENCDLQHPTSRSVTGRFSAK